MGGLGAADIIRLLGLEPHPEGGHYRETFRDAWQGADGRAASTAIYFLLARGEVSRWHRIDAAEVWHWYAGASLELTIAAGTAPPQSHILGVDLASGARPQIVVPAGAWQQARASATSRSPGVRWRPASASSASSWHRRGSTRCGEPRSRHSLSTDFRKQASASTR